MTTQEKVALNISAYIKAFVAANGHDVLKVIYLHGYYYVNGMACRESKLKEMTNTLLSRPPKKV